jgi:hypothetical protein
MPGKGNLWKLAEEKIVTNKSAGYLGRWVWQCYSYLGNVPSVVKEENYWFYNITNLAYLLISLLHGSWIFVFSAFHFNSMAGLQFASILSYLIAFYLNRRGHHLTAMLIAVAEVSAHQVVAAYQTGWGTGFQNFIPLIGLMPFLKYTEKWSTKMALALFSMAVYLYIDVEIKHLAPALPITAWQVSFLTVTNAIACFVLVTLWGIVLSVSYNRTVADLLKKEQQLFEMQKEAEQAEILGALNIAARDKEIFQLRNVELKNSNEEILLQKQQIEQLVSEQEQIIVRRTQELAEANKKLVQLVQYNAHSLREPLTRLMGAMMIAEYMERDEFFDEIWPPMGKAVNDLDKRILEVIAIANSALENYEQGDGISAKVPDIPSISTTAIAQ